MARPLVLCCEAVGVMAALMGVVPDEPIPQPLIIIAVIATSTAIALRVRPSPALFNTT
jgi:hypothetical protein